MNKMTSKQYLIDVTLKSLQVAKQNKSPSKVMCEIHYGDGDSYLRIKLQPILKNGIAMFYEERIRIPYGAEIALVFKILKTKKQTFLGHYTIDAEKYLQQKIYSLKLRQKLQEADAIVDFQIKIIDKQLFCDEESDDLDDQELFPAAKSIYSDQNRSRKQFSDYKAKSQLNTPFKIIKREDTMMTTPLPQQFAQLLLSVEDTLHKYKLYWQKETKIKQFQQSSGKNSATIQSLETHLEKAKANSKINTYLVFCVAAVLGFFIGLMMKSL